MLYYTYFENYTVPSIPQMPCLNFTADKTTFWLQLLLLVTLNCTVNTSKGKLWTVQCKQIKALEMPTYSLNSFIFNIPLQFVCQGFFVSHVFKNVLQIH